MKFYLLAFVFILTPRCAETKSGDISTDSSGQIDVGVDGNRKMNSETGPTIDGCATGFLEQGNICVDDPEDLGTTFYVRIDGGTLDQCDGTKNTPYDGSTGKCAWNHPWVAFPPKGSSNITPFQGGDTLFLGDGEYKIGTGALVSPGTDTCSDPLTGDICTAGPIPSGTNSDPTRVVGSGFDTGCVAPPQLWGTFGTATVVNLEGSTHVVLSCLDITDHQECSREHPELSCDNNLAIVDGYAKTGITAVDSKSILIRDVKIHGLDIGISAGRVEDWTLERVVVRGNKDYGWYGGGPGDRSNSGDIRFSDGSIQWTGCIERYPEVDLEPIGCLSQDRGGNGDGLASAKTGGRWILEDFDFLFNVSDGLDLSELEEPGQLIIKGGRYEGNARTAINAAGGGHQIEDVEVIGNCGFFKRADKWPDMVNPCHDLGNTMWLNGTSPGITPPDPTKPIVLKNLSVWSEGDCAIVFENQLDIQRSIFRGGIKLENRAEHACFAKSENQGALITAKDTVVFDFDEGNSGCEYGIDPAGVVGHCEDPKFIAGDAFGSINNATQSYDLGLSDTSPFKNYIPAIGRQ